MALSLNSSTLAKLPGCVSRPGYDRSALRPGILHIGVGNFHRAHQAVYLNDLLNAGGDPAWAIRGAGVRDTDARMRGLLSEQDWLYSLVEVDGMGHRASVIGSMIDFVPVQPDGNAPLVAAMSDPATRIVSLTVTEGGYFLNSEGAFDRSHNMVSHDIGNPAAPRTVFGAILAALAARRADGVAPFTVMSCDNLPGNGHITRDVTVGLAGAMDADFGKWVEENVAFPNGMVDRITPATGERERSALSREFGIDDNFPVFCEPFRQWVLEDKFTDGRPELEHVGVTFTDDIASFEQMKLRILNAGHTILSYASAMLGIEYVHEAMGTPLVSAFVRKTLERDVTPFVAEVPGFTPLQYLDLICARFSNPGVADTIARICYDGSNKTPKFIVGSVLDNLNAGRTPEGLALGAAIWCRYCLGQDENGKTIPANDPNWDSLQDTARRAQDDPGIWLSQKAIYGSAGQNQQFRAAFARFLRSLQESGTERTLRGFLNGSEGNYAG
jgi:mannitol 2-dehydrogenase